LSVDILSRMKYFFTLLCSILFTINAFAQPANNDCIDFVNLGTAPVCTGDIYTNVDATSSSIDINDVPTCFNSGVVNNDVYFAFTVDALLVDVTISVIGTDQGPNGIPIENPQFSLYRGACGGLAELLCVSSNLGDNTISLDAVGLTPGITYFLRIDSYSDSGTPVWGDFTVCIEEFIPAFNMGEATFTNSCTGTIFDSGGPEEDYGNAENSTFTICPTDFSQCIALDLSTFNMLTGDELNVYAGATTAAPQIASITGNSLAGGFVVEASSTCITLEFTSDGFSTSAGFEASWQCSPLACDGSNFDNATPIGSIPYTNNNLTTCGEAANFNTTPCGNLPFLNGPETVFVYESPGDLCATVQVTGATSGTGVAVLSGLPGDPETICVASSTTGSTGAVDFQEAGTYYIIVANPEGCTDFGLNIQPAPCLISPTLASALCNPLNGCVDFNDLTSTLTFEDGSEDVLGLDDAGCWLGNGFQTDYLWFTIQAQADGPFGFILEGTNMLSDIDINVWGPFTPEEVCEDPAGVTLTIQSTDPIRSTWTGGFQSTGLADIHPVTGIEVTDAFDCGSLDTPGAGGDRFVSTIPAQEGEVYVVLANDFGNNITDGNISIDWGPSNADVLAPVGAMVAQADTSVCANEPVQLDVITGLDGIEWVGDNIDELSCTDCYDPIATPDATTVYRALIDAVCFVDTLDVTVNVFDLDAGPDLEVCIGEELEIPAGQDFNTATYAWDPPAGLTFSCTDCPTPVVTAAAPGTYEVPVTLTAAACNFMDMVTITVLDFSAAEYAIADDDRICFGESITIGGDEIAGNTYSWTSIPNTEIEGADTANPTVSPDVTTTYYIAALNSMCPIASVDSVTVVVTPLPEIEIAESYDESLCRGDTITLSNTVVEDDVNYTWTGPAEIFNPDSTFTQVATTFSGSYILVGERLGCESSDTLMVDVVPILVDLNQPDTVLHCLGDTLELNTTVVPGDVFLEWSPSDIVNNNDPLLTPNVSTTYVATVTVGACVRVDSFYMQVDSLPLNMSIMADPEKDPYCQGELVTLVSPIYDPVFYPNITHEWLTEGEETPDSLYNLVLTTQDTFTHVRTTVNGGCVEMHQITLNVVTAEGLEIIPSDPAVCPGESIQLTVADTTIQGIEWTPETGLSCTDCPNPIATPSTTTTYTVSAEVEGCSITNSVTVLALETPDLPEIDAQTICPDDVPVVLNPGGSTTPGSTYMWTADNDPNFSSAEISPVVSPTETTVYTLVETNICGSDSTTTGVTVVERGDLINANGGMDTLVTCRGFEFDLSANVLLSGNGNNSLVWEYNGEQQDGADVTYTATESGVATFTYIYGQDEDTPCEQETASVMIIVNDAPENVDVLSDTTICFNDLQFFVLNSGDGEPGVSYTWTSSTGETFLEPNPEVMPEVTTTYVLEASLGECTVVDSVTITIIEEITTFVPFEVEDPVTPENMTVVLEVDSDAATDLLSWEYQDNGIGTGNPFTWELTEAEFDSLPGYVYATLFTGCQLVTDSVFVRKVDIRIPNIFSPNNDGTNDVFRPFYRGEMDVVEVTVYNRWGNVVFESSDVNNPGWDGKNNDKDAPSDVYLYKIRIGIGGVIMEENGQVTLVR
jgi:gliding motility-associated-like protein